MPFVWFVYYHYYFKAMFLQKKLLNVIVINHITMMKLLLYYFFDHQIGYAYETNEDKLSVVSCTKSFQKKIYFCEFFYNY